ncbi:MAG: restriction endonuclease subunit S [Methanobrevibacter sp.]|jgi:type I restriction enzyme S subunit|nr:restriction endonuclease subunit S [Candidatus Methanoflexus mossambicus]
MGSKPKLRFKEFSDDWEEKKLGDLAIIRGRIGWKNLKQSEYTKKGPYLIAGKHIHNGVIDWKSCDHISQERYEESKEIALKNGDIIFSKDGSLGNPALIQDLKTNATINSTMMLVRFENNLVDSSYFYQILKSKYFFNLLWMLKSGSSIPHIFQRDMKNFKFPLTTINEQRKVANFLSITDEKIINLENIFILWKKYKKKIMQLIFSQELRFKDENGEDYPDWEEKRLKDIIAIKKGSQLNKSDMIIDGRYYVLNGGIEPSGYINNWNTCENTITISEGGNSCGYVKFNKEKFWCGGHCYFVDKFKINIHNLFLFQELKYLQDSIMKLRVGSGLPNIQKGDIENFKINVPIFEEQEKISNFLMDIDDKIENVDFQLKELQEFKKSLLQKMFV